MASTDFSPPCEVAILEDLEPSIHVTIIGDFFAAESVSGSIHKGYERTLFTRHGASIREKIEQFDQEFEERLRTRGWTAENSCKKAIDFFEKKLQNCATSTVSSHPKGTCNVSIDPIPFDVPDETQISCDQTVD